MLLLIVAVTVLIVLIRGKWGPLHSLDFDSTDALNRYLATHRWQVRLWKLVSVVAGPTSFQIAALGAAVVLWLRRRRRLALFVTIAMIGAAILSGLIKTLLHRARPAPPVHILQAHGASFPSGHALSSLVGVGVLLALVFPVLSRTRRVVLAVAGIVLVTAVGFSRIILGVHYVSDVVGGWLIGGAWLLAAVGVLQPSGTGTHVGQPRAERMTAPIHPDLARGPAPRHRGAP